MADDLPLSPPQLQQVPLSTLPEWQSLNAIPKAAQTIPPVNIPQNMSDARGRIINTLGDVTGITDAGKALRGEMTPEEAQQFAFTSALGLIPGAEELAPAARVAETAAEEAVPLASKVVQAMHGSASLPMDEASRMARAAEQGYTLDAYHGTKSPVQFSEFQTGDVHDDEGNLIHGFSRDPNALLGPHFAKEPSVANKFAEGNFDWLKNRVAEGNSSVYPVKLNSSSVHKFGSEDELNNFIYGQNVNSPEIEDILSNDHNGDMESGGDKYDSDPKYRAQVNRKAVLNENGYDEPSSKTSQELADAARSEFEKNGNTLIQYPNAVEGGTSYISLAPPRSRFAAFNPANKDSGFLLGSLAGLGGLGLAQNVPLSNLKVK